MIILLFLNYLRRFMHKNYKLISAAFAASLLLTACSFISEKKEKAPAPQKHLSREEIKAAWERSMSLSEEHKVLKNLAGDWIASVKFWTQPGTNPNVSSAKSFNKIILSDKFLVEDYQGSFSGKPFQGLNILGFDTILNKFSNYWADNMGTGAIYSEGSFDPDSNTITFNGFVTDPVSQTKRPTLSTLKIVDNDNHFLEMYDILPDGNKFKTLEIEYRRNMEKK